MTYRANVFDLTELDSVTRMIVGDWFDTDDVDTLDSDRIDESYIRIVGDDAEQVEARVDILSGQFDVRIEERADE